MTPYICVADLADRRHPHALEDMLDQLSALVDCEGIGVLQTDPEDSEGGQLVRDSYSLASQELVNLLGAGKARDRFSCRADKGSAT